MYVIILKYISTQLNDPQKILCTPLSPSISFGTPATAKTPSTLVTTLPPVTSYSTLQSTKCKSKSSTSKSPDAKSKKPFKLASKKTSSIAL